ncbi:MAG TPA: T9SS type A sorting domain-containing protein, partial [Panacibacter sp.]|nr:T9SS type A sorting domain-containing protein [Panacibacter sp.]
VGFGQGTCVQTGLNGEVYVCYADHTSVVSPYAATGMGFVRSVDGGATFTPATVIFPYSGTRVDYTYNTYNFTRVNDFPSMAVDKSSRFPGRIYIAYPEKNSVDGHSEIKVRFSNDQGATWSAAKVVNIPAARQSFFPWITVDATNGVVMVAYYALDQATGYATNTYVAVSLNGKKWLNQKVSDVSHITAPINNGLFATGYAGDYIGIAASGGKAYPTWMDNRNGTWQVYCSPVTITLAALADGQQEIAAIKPSASLPKVNKLTVEPNPFTSIIRLSLSNNNIRSVELFHQNGMLTKQWSNISSGTLNVASVPKGTYIIKVTDKDNKVYTQTLIKE